MSEQGTPEQVQVSAVALKNMVEAQNQEIMNLKLSLAVLQEQLQLRDQKIAELEAAAKPKPTKRTNAKKT